MKKSKYSEAQPATSLRKVEAGAPMAQVTRKLGISEQIHFLGRKQFGQMTLAEIRLLRRLEEENRKLKQRVKNLTLDKVMLQEALTK